MKRSILISICFALVFFIFANEVSACKCAPQDANERFASAEKVFLGKVLSVKPYGDGLSAEIEVIDSWKGVDTKQITVTTPTTDGGSCGVSFVVGEEKLLWVNGSSAGSCDSAVENGSEFLSDKPKLKINGTVPTENDSSSQQSSNDSTSETSVNDERNSESDSDSNGFIIFLIAFFIIDSIAIGLFVILRRRKK